MEGPHGPAAHPDSIAHANAVSFPVAFCLRFVLSLRVGGRVSLSLPIRNAVSEDAIITFRALKILFLVR